MHLRIFLKFISKKNLWLYPKNQRQEWRARALDINQFCKLFFLKIYCAKTKFSKKCGLGHAPAHFFKVYFKKNLQLFPKNKRQEWCTRTCDINWFCKLFFLKIYCAKTKFSKKCGLGHAPAHFFKVYLKKNYGSIPKTNGRSGARVT